MGHPKPDCKYSPKRARVSLGSRVSVMFSSGVHVWGELGARKHRKNQAELDPEALGWPAVAKMVQSLPWHWKFWELHLQSFEVLGLLGVSRLQSFHGAPPGKAGAVNPVSINSTYRLEA